MFLTEPQNIASFRIWLVESEKILISRTEAVYLLLTKITGKIKNENIAG
jgi:hypothetical protein